MSSNTADFVYSSAPEPHRARTKEILQRHPEIRELIGHNPGTFFWTVGIVAFQFALAWYVPSLSWWLVVLLAYCVGAFANHALFVMIHDCTHRLAFKRKVPNMITELIANLPLSCPARCRSTSITSNTTRSRVSMSSTPIFPAAGRPG